MLLDKKEEIRCFMDSIQKYSRKNIPSPNKLKNEIGNFIQSYFRFHQIKTLIIDLSK